MNSIDSALSLCKQLRQISDGLAKFVAKSQDVPMEDLAEIVGLTQEFNVGISEAEFQINTLSRKVHLKLLEMGVEPRTNLTDRRMSMDRRVQEIIAGRK